MQSFGLKECTVPYLKDLIHICLETERQGYGNVIHVRSKCTYCISYRGLCLNRSCLQCTSLPNRPISSISSQSAAVEIDCTQPEIRVSPAHRRTVEIDIVPAANTSSESPNTVQVPSSTASSESGTQKVIKISRRNTQSSESEGTTRARGCTSAPIDFK